MTKCDEENSLDENMKKIHAEKGKVKINILFSNITLGAVGFWQNN